MQHTRARMEWEETALEVERYALSYCYTAKRMERGSENKGPRGEGNGIVQYCLMSISKMGIRIEKVGQGAVCDPMWMYGAHMVCE